jgi:hypothetical protein
MSQVHSYPKIFNVGHAAITALLMDDVLVEEKLDGSQFSFGVFDGELRCRSKGKDQPLDAPDKMFEPAVASIRSLEAKLVPGWTYRGEYLAKPQHNTLPYDRVPRSLIALFDINPCHGQWLKRSEKEAEADRIGLEIVPVLFEGRLESIAVFEELAKQTSFLGGPQIEGVVIKNYHRFGRDGHPLFGKHVREDFKEQHSVEWKAKHQSMADIRDELGKRFQAPARWQKAVQRLRDDGRLTNSPKDIGTLIKEVQKDLGDEIREEVAARLMDWAWPHVVRVAGRGLPEWYKQKLLESQFGGSGGDQ